MGWLTRDPGLMLMEFCFWDYVKQKICIYEPTTADDTKKRITNAFHVIAPDILAGLHNSLRRKQRCTDNEENVFEYLNNLACENIERSFIIQIPG